MDTQYVEAFIYYKPRGALAKGSRKFGVMRYRWRHQVEFAFEKEFCLSDSAEKTLFCQDLSNFLVQVWSRVGPGRVQGRGVGIY